MRRPRVDAFAHGLLDLKHRFTDWPMAMTSLFTLTTISATLTRSRNARIKYTGLRERSAACLARTQQRFCLTNNVNLFAMTWHNIASL